MVDEHDPRPRSRRGPGAASLLRAAKLDEPGRAHRDQVVAYVEGHADAAWRQRRRPPTGLALVVDAAASGRSMLHRKLGRWSQPGATYGDANLAAVAHCEAREETGLVGLRGGA
ncbi:MAG: hypothetical protein R2711_04035 [Acidimicrobiales bacterium]